MAYTTFLGFENGGSGPQTKECGPASISWKREGKRFSRETPESNAALTTSWF